MKVNRRDALKLGVLSGAAVVLPMERVVRARMALANRLPESMLPAPFTVPYAAPPVIDLTDPSVPTLGGSPYQRIEMTQFNTEIIPGLQTPVWGYNGAVPGPTIYARRGVPVVVRQVNNLPDTHPQLGYRPWTSVHLHGSPTLPQYDGYASDITGPQQYKDYHWPNTQEARTMWYHDHGVHRTASNVYMGLVAQYHLFDSAERALPLPKGTDFEGKSYDQPLTIQDAMFGTDGSLIYNDRDESGFFGDVILVNGRPWPVMRVERRKYRFRILNASVSRGYRLELNTKQPFTVIGTDGGLMPHPQQVQSFRHGMGERYEVVIDFADNEIGQRVVLRNLSLKNNVGFSTTRNVMAFDVVSESTESSNNAVPDVLNDNMNVMGLLEDDATAERNIRFKRANGHWTINGKTWADVEDSGFRQTIAKPGLGDTEIWNLRNPSGGWFHPVHIHLVDFRIISRNDRPPEPYEQGPKDVAYVGEEERVRVIMRFGPHPGRYMLHCHNLVHEDHDMMHQFWVQGPDGEQGDDPIWADPPKDFPELDP